ncbi:MAG: AAA family ATPase [Parachlamydiaceae bacterium]
MDIDALTVKVQATNQKFKNVQEEISKVIVGQKSLIEGLLIALLAEGHLLLEGLPGLAKTLAVTTLSQVIDCQFKRIQFTPDLLPADLIGTSIYNPKDTTFSISKGPIFTNILLADEINRAPAKVQSALLEVMQEKQVTIAGQTFKIAEPYLVLATQNPIEQEGTYHLPEAQTDRFMMKIKIDYPTKEEEEEILKKMATLGEKPTVEQVLSIDELLYARTVVNRIYIDPKLTDYILDIVFATRYPEKYQLDLENLILYGASPRASIALVIASKAHAFLSNRGYVTPYDVKRVAYNVLRHRLKLTYEAEAEELSADEILNRIFDRLLVP